ncbi:MAG TPA: ARMT1-like domain-containing protein [Clostridia bacterium]|nr:ARMT1-like domain-containing protein [Clostridia bacterium]
MKIFLDCLPCMLRQVLESAHMATDDETVHERIMDEAVKVLSEYKQHSCAPELCEAMHIIVKKHTGVDDPYSEIKSRDISSALKLEPIIRKFAISGENLLIGLLKVSATGNVMDSALYSDLDIEACLTEEMEKPFVICDDDKFNKDIDGAETILIIGDNAGEAVFDKPLAEHLSCGHKVIYAVRDVPIINDATVEDAFKTGIADYSEVVSTGCGMPGAVIESCSIEFQEMFNNADVVISKGQGNFEALSDTTRSVYFLLKAKCCRIANALDVEINEYVFKKNQ